MNKSGKRHRPTAFDALDVPLVSRKKPLLHSGAHFTKFSVKLRALLDQERYPEAKLLFTEMVKSSKYDFKNLWQAGIEVIGRSSPQDLVGYLKAVFISAPPRLSSETFNVYIDQLLLEQKWAEALEEMELRYNTPIYHHPIVLRKMALCAYHLWEKAYNELPENYFEEEEHNQYDTTHVRYQKYLRAAAKYLAEAHNTYLRDSEILEIYFTFLQKLKDKELKKEVILKSLSAFEQDPEYYLLFSLMKHNKKNRYFNNDDYIIPLYEFNPFLDEKVKRLHSFCKKTLRKLKSIDETADEEERTRLIKLLIRIFRLFVTRIEHGNVELWFCRTAVKICTIAMNQEIEDVYFYYNVDELLRSAKSLQQQDMQEVISCADQLKDIVSDFIIRNKSLKNETQGSSNSNGIEDEEPKWEGGKEWSEEEELGLAGSFLEKESFYEVVDSADEREDIEENAIDESEGEEKDSPQKVKDNQTDDDVESRGSSHQEELEEDEQINGDEKASDTLTQKEDDRDSKANVTLIQEEVEEVEEDADAYSDSLREIKEEEVKLSLSEDIQPIVKIELNGKPKSLKTKPKPKRSSVKKKSELKNKKK